MEYFRSFINWLSVRISLPIVLFSPMLFLFTVYSCMDETFIDSDKQAVIFLWCLVACSFFCFLVWKKDGEPPPNLILTLGTAQLACLIAACFSIMAVVDEDSNTYHHGSLAQVFKSELR